MDKSAFIYVFKTVVLFLILSFFTDKGVFILLNKISDEVYSGQSIGKLNQYLKLKDDLDFVIYGSSRANHNIDPGVLGEKGFNMGMDGSKLAYGATLIKVLPQNKKQLVLLHLDPENFFSKDYAGEDIKVLKTKYNRNSIITSKIDELKQNNIFQKFYWSLNYNGRVLGVFKNYFRPNYDYKEYSGYDPIYVTQSQRQIFQKILNQGKFHPCRTDLRTNDVYNNLLIELIKFCEENDKELFIFTSPVFNDSCKSDNQLLKKLMSEKGIRYVDFTDFFKNDPSLKNWKDKTHLSNEGAERFSKIFKKTVGFHDIIIEE